MNQVLSWPEVLTLAEAARFLRVPQKKIKELAESGKIPARQIDQTWRFLKSALEDWLRGRDKVDGKTAMLRLAGVFEGDEALSEIRAAAYAARGRSETE